MYKHNLLLSTTKYYRNSDKKNKLDKTVKSINDLHSTNGDDLIYVIPHDVLIYDSLLLTLCDGDYHVYVYNKKKKNCSNLLLKLPENILNGLIKDLNISMSINDFKKINSYYIVVVIFSKNVVSFEHAYHEFTNYKIMCNNSILNNTELFPLLIIINKLFKLQSDNILNRLCILNMTIENNKLIVYDLQFIHRTTEYVKHVLNNTYNFHISNDELSKFLQKCHTQGYQIYTGTPTRDRDTDIVKKFHLDVKRSIYKKYCSNVNIIFDMGCGRLTDMFFWNDVGIKNVYCIEPSHASVTKGQQKYAKNKRTIRTNIHVVEGFGDVDWNINKQYNDVINKKYDVVTFQYTIHYMIDNIGNVMNNLKRITKTGTKIIITCMNGTLIKKELETDKQIIIRNGNGEILFAIAEMDVDSILVYLKGGYGMEHGSIEKIIDIDILIKTFIENNYKLLENKPFLNYDSKTKNVMTNTQKKISKYYISLMFEKL